MKIKNGIYNNKIDSTGFYTGLVLSRFDLEFESFGLCVLVDKKSHIYIKGTEIDWSNDLNDRGLKFNNPAAKGSCGCKTSFMYEHTEQTNVREPSWM